MPVGDLAAAFMTEARNVGIDLRPGTVVPWLSGRGHLEPGAAAAPRHVLARLSQIHAALGGRDDLLASKRAQYPKVDFFLANDTIVELDEIQHFSSERLVSLNHYEGMRVDLDVSAYRELVAVFRSVADKAWAQKTAADFPFPGGRRAQRAYLDAVRDLLAPAFGYRLVRVAAPEGSIPISLERLLASLASS
jgi:hypothetical protein